jgi:hypothetical protein
VTEDQWWPFAATTGKCEQGRPGVPHLAVNVSTARRRAGPPRSGLSSDDRRAVRRSESPEPGARGIDVPLPACQRLVAGLGSADLVMGAARDAQREVEAAPRGLQQQRLEG